MEREAQILLYKRHRGREEGSREILGDIVSV